MSAPSDIVHRPEELPAPLPDPVGHLSWHVCELLRSEPQRAGSPCPTLSQVEIEAAQEAIDGVDPLIDDDLHLALYICFELGYRGFADVDPIWEGEIPLLQLRALLEGSFLNALDAALPPEPDVDPNQIGDRLFELERDDDGPPLARFLESQASIDQFREFVIHRSAYQLKEADPHSWAIPRLDGPPKAALLEIQVDEYGGGRSERMHSHLFATTMRELGLDPRLERVPRPAAGIDPGDGQPDVRLRDAPGAPRGDRRPPCDVRDDLLAPEPRATGTASAGSEPIRRPSTSTTSTSRPTPSTRTSPPTTCRRVLPSASPVSPPTSSSAPGRCSSSRRASPRVCCDAWRAGETSLREPAPRAALDAAA